MSSLVIGLKPLSQRITVPSLDPVAYPSLLPCMVNIAPCNDSTFTNMEIIINIQILNTSFIHFLWHQLRESGNSL